MSVDRIDVLVTLLGLGIIFGAIMVVLLILVRLYVFVTSSYGKSKMATPIIMGAAMKAWESKTSRLPTPSNTDKKYLSSKE